MDHFIKKEGFSKDSTVNENNLKEKKKIDKKYSEDANSVFNFDNEFGTKYNFSYSNNIERNEVCIDPRDIFHTNIFNENQKKSQKFEENFQGTNINSIFKYQSNTKVKANQTPLINSSRNPIYNNSTGLNETSYVNNKNPPNLLKKCKSADINRNINENNVLSRQSNITNPNFQFMHPSYYNGIPLSKRSNNHFRYNVPLAEYNRKDVPHFIQNNNKVMNQQFKQRNNFQSTTYEPRYVHLPVNIGIHNHIINPTNNSVLNINRNFVSIEKHKNLKKPFKKIITIKVDGTALHAFKTVNVSFNFKSICSGFNETTFLTYVNSFNETLGIMKIPYKYGTVLSFVFNELKKCNGYFNTSLITWNQLSQVIKHFSWINQIYLFLVYPFEQFVCGFKQIRVYEDLKIFKSFEIDFSRFSTTDIDICLSKGKIPDIFFLLEILDPCKVKIDGIMILLNFFVDIIHVKFRRIFKEKQMVYKPKEFFNNKSESEARSLYEKIRKNFFVKLENVEEKKSLFLLKKCISLSIEHGKMCKKKYLGFNIDQSFLNMVLNIMVMLKENSLFEIDLILDFIRFCGKTYFFENSFLFKFCYKHCKTDPVFTLEILSNVKFSRIHNKKFLKRLNKFILPKIEFFSNQFNQNQILDDSKLLENIIRSFVCVKSMKNRFKEVFKKILMYFDYLYTNRLFYKKRNSSDLFKIILVMMSYEDVKIFIYSDYELVKRLKIIPGIRDLV